MNHLSVISLDFTKAFDKIGIHTVVDELQSWKFGPKIINYCINFMNNRKVKVYANNHFSFTRPQHNGIPQGSPLSVILFLLAFNKLNLVILNHKQFNFCAYADDYNIFKRINKDTQINIDHSMTSTLGVNTPALSSHSTRANIIIFVKNTPANFEYPLYLHQ